MDAAASAPGRAATFTDRTFRYPCIVGLGRPRPPRSTRRRVHMTDAESPASAVRPMMQRDQASAALGMVVEHDEPGHSTVSMIVRDDMTNGFAVTHGGLVFALADTAFAIACNEDESVTVAAGADITFLKS